MRVLALGGAGAVCSEAVRDLAQYSDFDEIVIGEIAVERAEALRQEIGDPRISVMRVDATDHEVMVRVFRHFDVIMNGLPFRFDLAVTRAAVEAGVSGLDLSSEEDQFAYEEEARRKGITFIPGVGATPGVTNIMAAQGVSRMDAVEEIQINFAAFRCLAPAPGLLTTTIWEFHPEQEERAYYEDGQFYPVPPFAGEKTVAFPEPIGEQKVYFVPHDETYTLSASYRDKGLRRVSVRGCFPPPRDAPDASHARSGAFWQRAGGGAGHPDYTAGGYGAASAGLAGEQGEPPVGLRPGGGSVGPTRWPRSEGHLLEHPSPSGGMGWQDRLLQEHRCPSLHRGADAGQRPSQGQRGVAPGASH